MKSIYFIYFVISGFSHEAFIADLIVSVLPERKNIPVSFLLAALVTAAAGIEKPR
ncbi:hypothetical protein [Undibacterium sp. TC9W]|uniref:hypothetical protein n=1 Tax=Undibacterium sp. TC9W TaxID=3413053 RepID=UPI003BF19018